jgi:Flp pilus assembly protein TadG
MLKRLLNQICGLCVDRRANIATTFALTVPIIFGAAGVAVDYILMSQQQTSLQRVADAAALDAARELGLVQSSGTDVASIAQNYASGMLSQLSTPSTPIVTAAVIDSNQAVQVDISESYQPTLSGLILKQPVTITAHAVARAVTPAPICFLALDPKAPGTLQLQDSAVLTAVSCAVYSDSTNPQGMKAVQGAVINSTYTCSAGGKVGNKINFNPDPLTDCPVMADPLISRAPPTPGACSFMNKVVDGMTVTLNPGTYCGGLTITDGANVTLGAGVFIIKDGPFVVNGGSTLQGTGTGIYLTGTSATLSFGADTTISLTAPKDGPLSGILVFEDRAEPPLQVHQILSNNARTLHGTVYIPQGQLVVNATQPIADKSLYTIIVTRRMQLYSGPNLVLNSDYADSDIPVPTGLGPTGVYLTQ